MIDFIASFFKEYREKPIQYIVLCYFGGLGLYAITFYYGFVTRSPLSFYTLSSLGMGTFILVLIAFLSFRYQHNHETN